MFSRYNCYQYRPCKKIAQNLNWHFHIVSRQVGPFPRNIYTLCQSLMMGWKVSALNLREIYGYFRKKYLNFSSFSFFKTGSACYFPSNLSISFLPNSSSSCRLTVPSQSYRQEKRLSLFVELSLWSVVWPNKLQRRQITTSVLPMETWGRQ